MQITSVMKKLRDRLGRDDGYTLVELITVMAILGIVLAPLSSSFASGMVAQASQTRREQAYANARVALQRLRLDVHCASAVTSVEQNSYGGFTLTLTESNDQSPARLVPRRHSRGCRLVRRSVVHGSLPGLDDAIRPLSIPRDESHRLRRRLRLDVRDELPCRAAGRLADELGCRRELRERHADELGRQPLADIGDVPERVPADALGRFQRQRRSGEPSERALRDEGFDHAPQRPSLLSDENQSRHGSGSLSLRVVP